MQPQPVARAPLTSFSEATRKVVGERPECSHSLWQGRRGGFGGTRGSCSQAAAPRMQPQPVATKPLFLGRAPPADGWGRRISLDHVIFNHPTCFLCFQKRWEKRWGGGPPDATINRKHVLGIQQGQFEKVPKRVSKGRSTSKARVKEKNGNARFNQLARVRTCIVNQFFWLK